LEYFGSNIRARKIYHLMIGCRKLQGLNKNFVSTFEPPFYKRENFSLPSSRWKEIIAGFVGKSFFHKFQIEKPIDN